jgi:hypothetical protein
MMGHVANGGRSCTTSRGIGRSNYIVPLVDNLTRCYEII